uniref:Putative secreted protein n=1 Tax=Anopheles marajoara TaxID=58244 RepID=A0A2M4C8L8_9DIPT
MVFARVNVLLSVLPLSIDVAIASHVTRRIRTHSPEVVDGRSIGVFSSSTPELAPIWSSVFAKFMSPLRTSTWTSSGFWHSDDTRCYTLLSPRELVSFFWWGRK